MMPNVPPYYTPTFRASAFPADRPIGIILMVLSAMLIPITILASVVMGAIFGSTFLAHLVHFHGVLHSATRGFAFLGMVISVASLASMVYAGYSISRSQRQGFVLALVIGCLTMVLHGNMIALAIAVYSGLRLGGLLGTKPE